jgi:cytochrome c-type biogenesis protein
MEFAGFAAAALWLGILTAISPCPLATNIAAISYIGARSKGKGAVVLSGVLYSLGRAAMYVVIAFAVIKFSGTAPAIADFINMYMNKILGFLLIITGMFLTGLLKFDLPSISIPEKWQKALGNGGPAGAFMLGMLFALAMCPVSAAVFFISFIPLAIKSGSTVIMPVIYGIGTGAPVAVFAFAASLGAKAISGIYKKTAVFEKYAQPATGIIFILAGIFLILRYIFGVV